MRKTTIIATYLIFSMIACNSSIPSPELMCYDLIEELGEQYHNGKLFSGSCYTIYDEEITQIDEIRSYRKGKRHGVWVKYHKNGNIFYKSSAKNGEIHGLYNSYHANGFMADDGKMNKGYKDGVWQYFGINGVLYKKELYKNKQLIDEEFY